MSVKLNPGHGFLNTETSRLSRGQTLSDQWKVKSQVATEGKFHWKAIVVNTVPIIKIKILGIRLSSITEEAQAWLLPYHNEKKLGHRQSLMTILVWFFGRFHLNLVKPGLEVKKTKARSIFFVRRIHSWAAFSSNLWARLHILPGSIKPEL